MLWENISVNTQRNGTCSGNSGDPPLQPSSNNSCCVVIPAYQAQGIIGSLIREVKAQGLSVIVVNDASTDETEAEAREAGATVLTRTVNGGKGRALHDGLQAALQGGYQWVLTMDADGQHLPSEIPFFLREAASGTADLILGNRMARPTGMPFDRRMTNRFMSWILSRVAGQKIPDSQCGFRLISRPVLEKITLESHHFEIESELAVKSAWAGFRIVSVPVSSVYQRQKSFIHPIRDTFRFFRFLFSLKRR